MVAERADLLNITDERDHAVQQVCRLLDDRPARAIRPQPPRWWRNLVKPCADRQPRRRLGEQPTRRANATQVAPVVAGRRHEAAPVYGRAELLGDLKTYRQRLLDEERDVCLD